MVTILLMITTYIIARRRGYGGNGDPFSWGPFLTAAWDGKWSIGAPVIILGGIYGGAFTPTEAAGVAVFYSLFVGVFIYRELTVTKIIDVLRLYATHVRNRDSHYDLGFGEAIATARQSGAKLQISHI